MSDKHKHIDSHEFEKRYSSNLSEEDKKAIESGAEEGSFEAEAFEGFNALENDALAQAAIKDIRRQVAARTGLKKERKLVFPIWKSLGIAAAVALFLVAGFMVNDFMKQEPSLAKNESSEVPEFVPDNFEDAINVAESEEEIKQLDDLRQEMEDSPIKAKELLIDEPIDLQDIVVVAPEKEERPAPKEESPNQSLDVENDLVESADEVSYNPPAPVTTTISENKANSIKGVSAKNEPNEVASSTEPTAAENSYFSIGKTNYAAKNYSTALEYFQNSLDSEQRVVESQYYSAMSYYNLNKTNKAIKYFDMVLSNNTSALRYNAMWYKAIILEEKGDEKEAKELLESLSKGSSGFKNQAADKLKGFK